MDSGAPMTDSEVEKIRREEPDLFHGMVKMHLSFLLDLNTDDCDCSFVYDDQSCKNSSNVGATSLAKRLFTPKKSNSGNKGVMDGVKLTHEGVCQVFQLIQYLGRPYNIKTEGIFRKTGNLKKQQVLKERLNKGVTMDLDEGEFSVHECAGVLKAFLSEMPDPLLTEAWYRAHCQVALLIKSTMSEEDQKINREKKIQCLQLLFLLIPEVNYSLLKDLLMLLVKVAEEEESNKMSVTNLGTLFSPLILCPRKLSAETLQSNHQMLTKAVTFMIEEAKQLFHYPFKLKTDLQLYLKNREKSFTTRSTKKSFSNKEKPQSPVVNTIFTSVDREVSSKLAGQSATETALAELYAHVQSMPESAQKRKLISKLNDANGQGTPGYYRSVPRKIKKKVGPGEGLKVFLTPKRNSNKQDESKLGRHGSYNLQVTDTPSTKKTSQVLNSFKKQNSESSGESVSNQKLLSPQSSPVILVSPSAIDSLIKQTHKECDEDETDLNGSYVAPPPFPPRPLKTFKNKVAPPIPERVSSLNPRTEVSPITNCTKKMTKEMQQNIMTPGNRKPVSIMNSAVELDTEVTFLQPKLVAGLDAAQESPCQPPRYNEDETDDMEQHQFGCQDKANEDESDSETENYFAALNDEEDETEKKEEDAIFTPGVSTERDVSEVILKTKAYTSRSLKKEFQQYLEVNDMVSPCDVTAASSTLDSSVTSSVIGKEAQMLLNGDLSLSDSMQAVLNGEEPLGLQADDENSTVVPSVLEPVDVDSALALSDIAEEDVGESEKENEISSSFISAKSDVSSYSATSTLACQDIPLPTTFGTEKQLVSTSTMNIQPENDNSTSRRRKRRSLTEISEINPISHQGKILQMRKNNIIFETDL